ncbi:MAG: urease accessory protein UreF [Alphaproteobacteria bacterium]|nr:urease accessory protein UreF [Alphaproteobacteria bacterium]
MIEEGRGFNAALYRLLAWFSPMFPIGAFSYSHGLETAAESGGVHDWDTLQGWIAAVLTHGAGRMDADTLRDAHRAASAQDLEALTAANRRGLAFRATSEMALEAAAQGEAFLATCHAAWRDHVLERWGAMLGAAGERVCHAAVVGAATARADIPLGCAMTAYLHAMAANLVSAGLRLGIVGQTDGQRILAALEPVIASAMAGAVARDPSAFGGTAVAVDLASMAHETQYTRLFRS